MQVLFHIDEAERWPLVLENVRNMLQYGADSGETFSIEILANARGVLPLLQQPGQDAALQAQMAQLAEKSVLFCACSNSFVKFGAGKAALCPFVSLVPAGVVELARRQQAGYAYIKP